MITYNFLQFYFGKNELLLVEEWLNTGSNLHDLYVNLISNGKI